jgi:hypothetical protein
MLRKDDEAAAEPESAPQVEAAAAPQDAPTAPEGEHPPN